MPGAPLKFGSRYTNTRYVIAHVRNSRRIVVTSLSREDVRIRISVHGIFNLNFCIFVKNAARKLSSLTKFSLYF